MDVWALQVGRISLLVATVAWDPILQLAYALRTARHVNCGIIMMDQRLKPPVERPKVEPEIIPPGSPDGREARIWLTGGDRRVRFVHIETRGLLAIVLALLMFGLVFLALLIFLVGVVVLWIPLALGFAAVLTLLSLFRARRR